MLRKHPADKIAIVTTQGKEGRDKQSIINALSPIAEMYGKELIAVGQPQIRAGNIADGKLQIPVFHYGINGINDLAGKYSVIWFVYAYYFNPTTIMEEIYKKHDRYINPARRQSVAFNELLPSKFSKNSRVYRYPNELGNLELTHGHKET